MLKMNVSLINRIQALTNSGHYYPIRSLLQLYLFQILLPSSIQPKGWLKVQLMMQLTGLNGRLFDISAHSKFYECS